MPSWQGKLSDDDIGAVIAWIQSRWPEEIYQSWLAMEEKGAREAPRINPVPVARADPIFFAGRADYHSRHSGRGGCGKHEAIRGYGGGGTMCRRLRERGVG
jgi:hypothetical protein